MIGMKRRVISVLLAVGVMLCTLPSAMAANESWRDPFVTRIMKTLSQDPTYTNVALTDLDRDGIPEAFVIKRGALGGIATGFTMRDNALCDIEVPANIIGECLMNIEVFMKNDTYIFVGLEVPRYMSQIAYYKLELLGNKLLATRIVKDDVSPYENLTYIDKYSADLFVDGYPNRSRIYDFIAGYDMVNELSAVRSSANIEVDGRVVTIDGYNVNDSNYFKVRDIAMLVRNTAARFNVEWNSELEAIELWTGTDYAVIGGELSGEIEQDMDVVENSTPIYVDAHQRAITAYNINGSSYFKIRDIGDAVGFDVLWNGDTQTISIITE